MLNDPMLPVWGLSTLNQPRKDLLGVSAWQAQGYTGKGVRIAVLDNRFRPNLEFLGMNVERPLSHDTGGGSYGKEEVDSHGQRVAEVIANIAPDATIVNLPYYEQKKGNAYDTLIRSLAWCRRNNIDIVNASISGSSVRRMQQISRLLVNDRTSLLCSSGNNGITSMTSDLPDWLAIARVDLQEDGSLQKKGASGEGIFCTSIGRWNVTRTTDEGAEWSVGGTSYSCPAASAMLALYYQRYREIHGGRPTQTTVRRFMLRSMQNPEGWVLPSLEFGNGLFVLPPAASIT